MANKVQISFLTDRFINTLIHYLQKLEQFVFLGLFSEVCQTCTQHALMGSGGSNKQVQGYGLPNDYLLLVSINLANLCDTQGS